MFIKKHLSMLTLFLLLSNVLMQGMNIDVQNTAHGTSTTTKLKKYDEFINSLNDEKYQSGGLLEQLIEMSATDSDPRYFEELMKHNVYAEAIKLKGLAIYKHYVENEHTKSVKLLLDIGADVDKVVREGDDDNATLLELAVSGCCFGGGMFIIKESDQIVKLLIKRGANPAIKFFEHPTLLQGIENQIASDSKMAKEDKEYEKKMAEMIKVRDLLANAEQIRADYLKKPQIKASNREQEKLQNIKADYVLKVNKSNFNLHKAIVSMRCPALLSL